MNMERIGLDSVSGHRVQSTDVIANGLQVPVISCEINENTVKEKDGVR